MKSFYCTCCGYRFHSFQLYLYHIAAPEYNPERLIL